MPDRAVLRRTCGHSRPWRRGPLGDYLPGAGSESEVLDEVAGVATRIASAEGIEGLTIGRLAEELAVSKSGVYAHFGSKEQLQHETIAAAQAIFEREVMHPALDAPEGSPRLVALCDL